ncbi:hypothetical protein Belba_3337 [Belliella baltica DSM 15883]|uniref:LTXXQ motif family protein n=1 Tax=Belliella baltica (strain DSM 15883 / CIP 108006 / LMG 21964 / BA134) TaxID=866536 RepID=I3Z9C3_BELBD|nr:hypothetical protein [Belliella baltica]AFL85841.1 hypothetical protein Belba_3337 [Belliella baltica DSM 15883]
MKNIKYLLTFLLAVLSFSVFSQREQKQFDREKYESARVAFITNRLDLKTNQAEKFWPIFNKYNEEKEKMIRNMSAINKESEGDVTEAKAKELIARRFDIQEEILDLEKKFMNDVTSVLSHTQALKLGGVNRDFVRQIYRMNQRGGQRGNN